MNFWQFSDNPKLPSIEVPSHLAWDFVIRENDVVASIQSRKKRRSARKLHETFAEYDLHFSFSPLNNTVEFQHLKEFFTQTHNTKEHKLTVQLDNNWLTEKILQGRVVEKLEVWQRDRLVGMKMYSYDEDDFYLSYKATEQKLDRQCELGLLLDVLSFERANSLGFSKVKCGKAKNTFGLQLQLSLLAYKCSLGLEMRIPQNAIIQNMHFESNNQDTSFVLMTYQSKIEKLFYVYSDGENPEYSSLIPPNLTLHPIAYSEFIKLQKVQ